MVLTVAKEGKMLLEPRPPGPVAIVMLSGAVTLTTASSAPQISLDTGMAAAFSPDIVDHVEVHRESAFLIVIGVDNRR
jgi:hypothetical protein